MYASSSSPSPSLDFVSGEVNKDVISTERQTCFEMSSTQTTIRVDLERVLLELFDEVACNLRTRTARGNEVHDGGSYLLSSPR